jgi:SPP1 gp7 family putative phage head morphogenesis protein
MANLVSRLFQKKPEQQPVTKKDLLNIFASQRTPYYLDSLVDGYNPNDFYEKSSRLEKVDEMLNDEQINGILELKKFFVLSTGWHVTIEDEEDANNAELKDFIATNLNSKYSGLFTRDLHSILSAMEYGFSVSEKIYQQIDGKIYLKRLLTVPPHSIDFWTNEVGDIDRIEQQKETECLDIPEWKVVHYVHNEKFGQPYGESDMQKCYRAWFLKAKVLKFWGIYLQRFASPFPVMKVPDEFGADKVDEAIALMNSVQQTSSLVIPESAELELKDAAKSSGEYDKAIERYNQMIGRAMLMPDLIGFGQTITGGSLALGKKHFQSFLAIIDFIRATLEDIINEKLVKHLIDLNFGKQEVYPEFRFLPFADDDSNDRMQLFLTAFEKGMPTTNEDFNHFRKIMDFPELDLENIEDDDLIEPTGKQDISSDEDVDIDIEPKPSPETEPEAPEGIEDGEGDDNDDMPVEVEATKEQEPDKFALARTPDKYESRMSFIRTDDEVKAMEKKITKRMALLLEITRDAYLEDLEKKDIIRDQKFSDIKKLQLKHKGDLKRVLKNGLMDIYMYSFNQSKEDLDKLVKQQKDDIEKSKELAEFKVTVTSTQVKNKEAIRLAREMIDAQAFASVGSLTSDLLDKSAQIVQSGLERGAGEREIAEQIREIYNKTTIGQAAAGLSRQPHLIETIVRTNSTKVFNQATLDYIKDPKIKGFIEMVMYSAVLDDRSTELCTSLDGLKLKVDDPAVLDYTPPNHFACRSRWVYITVVDVAMDNLSPDPAPRLDDIKQLQGSQFIPGR